MASESRNLRRNGEKQARQEAELLERAQTL